MVSLMMTVVVLWVPLVMPTVRTAVVRTVLVLVMVSLMKTCALLLLSAECTAVVLL